MNNKRPDAFEVLVYICDAYNDKIKGKQSILYNIKTIVKPSVITDLQMINSKITFKPFGNIKYELIDASDIERKAIVAINENSNEFLKTKKILIQMIVNGEFI